NKLELYLNGKLLKKSDRWQSPIETDVTDSLQQGANALAALGENETGIAALVLKLVIEFEDGSKQVIVSDESWKIHEPTSQPWQQIAFDDSSWRKPHVRGKLGDGPWMIPNYTAQNTAGQARNPLDPKNILTAP